MVKKILSILTWIVTVAGIIMLFVFSRNNYLGTPLKSIAITISRQHDKGFLNRKQMTSQLVTICDTAKKTAIGNINMAKVEKMLANNPWIKSATSYIDMDGRLLVKAEEFEPMLRVFAAEGGSVYVTKEGRIIPACATYTPRVLVANGNFKFNAQSITQAMLQDSIVMGSNIAEAFEICRAIENDALMKSCIGQLYCGANNDFELTVNGLQAKVIFGNADNAADKLLRLKLFLKQKGQSEELKHIKSLNLKYKNQLVVCTKNKSK